MPGNRPWDIACLLDSDIAIDFLRGRRYAGNLLQRWAAEGRIAVSSLTHLEVYHGMRPQEEDDTDAFLDGLLSIPAGVSIARRAGKMMAEFRAKGTTVGVVDAVIAATALELEVPLLTNNVAHYPFRGLNVVRGLQA